MFGPSVDIAMFVALGKIHCDVRGPRKDLYFGYDAVLRKIHILAMTRSFRGDCFSPGPRNDSLF